MPLHFDRLRLNGFKSFVDPTELVLRDGLTGVVGPNGCGKSNLLEALRWVMGEHRASAMRGEGMEDVIFAGTTRRPARAFAEVALSVDNPDRTAPAGFNDTDRIEITRRIHRDGGSTFRLNGREVRARDVQMLFADASTGAQSPALVRQGQIAELINARPKARRRVLEEAAGTAGLTQRRHEAELRLNAAQANLARLGDTLDRLAQQIATLTRQARAAARYRDFSAALRATEAALAHRRWSEAEAARAAAEAALAAAQVEVARAQAAADHATNARGQAEVALPPLRDEDQVAAALLARATLARESVEAEAAQASGALRAATDRLAQIDRDAGRETALLADARETLDRLVLEAEGLGVDDPAALAAADAAATQAAKALPAAEARLAEATESAAHLAAAHRAAERALTDLRTAQDRAAKAAETAAAQTRVAEAARTQADAALATAQADSADAQTRADTATAALTTAEAARTEAAQTEATARTTRARLDAEAAALAAEADMLAKSVDRTRPKAGAILTTLRVTPGHEAALGAAVGDALEAGVLTGQGSGWADLPPLAPPVPLPPGAAPLTDHVTGAPALARRLSQTGLVPDLAAARALQPALTPGQRLVTPDGDAVRWDGFVSRATDAPSAAAAHLRKVNDLTTARTRADQAEAQAATARAAHVTAHAALAEAQAAETAARTARTAADRALTDADRALSRAEADRASAEGRAALARAEAERHAAESATLAARLREAEAARAALPDPAAADAALTAARAAVDTARHTARTASAQADALHRDAAGRARRRAEIATDHDRWTARLRDADARAADLARRRDAAEQALATAKTRATDDTRLTAARATEATAQTRATTARAALAAGETALTQATAAERAALAAASTARETRAARAAEAQAATVPPRPDTAPDPALADRPAAALEAEAARLRTAREALGAVNLRAEEDRAELTAERDRLIAERDDCDGAIAKLRSAISALNREGRERLLAAFAQVNAHFGTLFTTLFGGGEARLVLIESDDPLAAGLDILAQPPGKKLATLGLLSGGEQTLTALALIFAVFLCNPAPICVLDEVDAPLDDANVTRFCDLMDAMRARTATRFLVITHHAVTMARMDRLFGVTMVEPGVSQLVSVDLTAAEALVA